MKSKKNNFSFDLLEFIWIIKDYDIGAQIYLVAKHSYDLNFRTDRYLEKGNIWTTRKLILQWKKKIWNREPNQSCLIHVKMTQFCFIVLFEPLNLRTIYNIYGLMGAFIARIFIKTAVYMFVYMRFRLIDHMLWK